MLTKLAGLKRYLATGALGLLAIAITWGAAQWAVIPARL